MSFNRHSSLRAAAYRFRCRLCCKMKPGTCVQDTSSSPLSLHAAHRYCDFHYPMYGHMCAVRDPPCPRPSAPGRLACTYHRRWEDSYNSWNRRGGWHVRSAAMRNGQLREVSLLVHVLHSHQCLGSNSMGGRGGVTSQQAWTDNEFYVTQ